MTISRRIASLLPAALLAASFAAVSLAPGVAMAAATDGGSRVESIAAKGRFSPVVPVECGLGFGLCAALLALGMDRRARRQEVPASWPSRGLRSTDR